MRLSTFSELSRLGSPLVLALAALSACDTSSTAAPIAIDPPHLSIDSIQSVGAPTWTPESPCLTPGADPAKTLSVNVGPRDDSGHLKSANKPPVLWTMAPPMACTGTPPCGFLELTMDSCTSADPSSCGSDPSSHALIIAASPSIPVSMAEFESPLGFYRFHVELKNQDGTPAEDEKGKTYPVELVVELKESCGTTPPPKDSGAPHRDGGSDAQVIGPDTGPIGPTDSSVTPVPDASVLPDSAPPPSDATTRPDGAGDARVRDATAGDSEPPVVPPDALAPI